MTEVTTEAELREILGTPLPRVATKDRSSLDDYDRQWLAQSPFCFVATSDADGGCDVSPKGDPPGFTLVPGRGDTLRINGRARLVREAPFFDRMTVKGHRPLLAVVVAIEQIFYHCPKAFLRSALWQPASWHPDAVPSRSEIARRLERPEESLESLETYYGPAYVDRLYRS